MLKDYTEIGIVLDCSGSMFSIKKSVIDGYNLFIEEQKKLEGKCVVTLTTFSDNVLIAEPRPLESLEKLTSNTYRPDGCTALWKAISNTIDTMGERFSKMEESERPEKVLIVIITDGEENASNSGAMRYFDTLVGYNQPLYTLDKINKQINHQKSKYAWEFIFIGTETLDVKGISKSFGIDHSYSFKQNDHDTRVMYADLSATTMGYRSTGNVNIKNSNI